MVFKPKRYFYDVNGWWLRVRMSDIETKIEWYDTKWDGDIPLAGPFWSFQALQHFIRTDLRYRGDPNEQRI